MTRFQIMLITIGLCISSLNPTRANELKEGESAPDIKVSHWISKPLADNSISGKTIILEFWGTWCPPCRKMIPHMNKLAGKFANDKTIFISLTYEDPEIVRKFLKKTTMDTSVVVDDKFKTWKAYGVSAVPYVVVINQKGQIAWKGHPYNLTEEKLGGMI